MNEIRVLCLGTGGYTVIKVRSGNLHGVPSYWNGIHPGRITFVDILMCSVAFDDNVGGGILVLKR